MIDDKEKEVFEDEIVEYEYNEEDDFDNSGLNYATYSIEESEEKNQIKQKNVKPFYSLLKIMFSPIEGWKTLRRQNAIPEEMLNGCYYPILALMASSFFLLLFYYPSYSLTTVITKAIICFVAYFFGYFAILLIFKLILSKRTKHNFETNFGKSFVIISLSTLAVFKIMSNIIPVLWPLLIFMPIWTVYLMFKGMRFFKLPKKISPFFLIVVYGSVLGIPALIDMLLTNLLVTNV